jgi:ribonuclease P protein component
MKKTTCLTSPNDFRRVFQSGSAISNKYVVLRYLLRDDAGDNRVAFVAGKSLGSAVVRNRAKRLLREAYRRNKEKITQGYDIVVIARSSLKGRTYWEAEKRLLSTLVAGGLIKREN